MNVPRPTAAGLLGRLKQALGGRPPMPIGDALWARTLADHGFLAARPAAEQARLRSLAEAFLARTRFAGAHGLTVTEAMGVAIAAQACLPVLGLGLDCYGSALEIIVYPDQFLVPRREVDADGLVHEEQAWLAGEASLRGPIILSWADVADSGEPAGPQVVIHEFIHLLDLADGEADGIPPLEAGRRRHWAACLGAAYGDFCAQLDQIEAAIPPTVDPDSAEADRWYALLPLDPYAAHDPAEFFAVSGEAYFTTAARLSTAFPDWFACLQGFFAPTTRTRD